MREFDPKLTPSLVAAAVANAERLLGDAEALEARGSFGPAASLTVVALEEMGKALALLSGDQIIRALEEPEPEPRAGEVVEHVVYTTVFDQHAVKKYTIFSWAPALAIHYGRRGPVTAPKSLTPDKLADVVELALRGALSPDAPQDPRGPDAAFRMLARIMPSWLAELEDAQRQYERFRVRGLYVDVVDGKLIDPMNLTAEAIAPLRAFAKGAIGPVKRAAAEGLPPEMITYMAAWVKKYGTTEATKVDRSKVSPPPGGWAEVDRQEKAERRRGGKKA
jgi:hypothetical protein